MKTIRYTPIDKTGEGVFEGVVVVRNIVRLSKINERITIIHLNNGEVLESEDSMNTIEARINSDD